MLSETAEEMSNTRGLASCLGTCVLSTCHAWLFYKQVHSINKLTEENSLIGKSEPRLFAQDLWWCEYFLASTEAPMVSVNALWLVSTLACVNAAWLV